MVQMTAMVQRPRQSISVHLAQRDLHESPVFRRFRKASAMMTCFDVLPYKERVGGSSPSAPTEFFLSSQSIEDPHNSSCRFVSATLDAIRPIG